MKKIVFDAREMEHPRPLMEAISILREMDNDSYLYMIHRKHPIPLIDLAEDAKYQVYSKTSEDGFWHVLICKNDTIDLKELILV